METRSAGVILDDAIARCGWGESTQVMLLLEYIDHQFNVPLNTINEASY